MPLSRDYNFVANTPAVADEVDSELDKLYAWVNNLPNEGLQNKAVDEAKLFPQNGLARSVGGDGTIAAPGGGWTNFGPTATFTPAAAAIAIVEAVFLFEVAPVAGVSNGQLQGRLAVDGVGQAEYAELFCDRSDNKARATVSQIYRIPLTAASHSLRLQHNYVSGANNGGKFNISNTGFSWWLLAQ